MKLTFESEKIKTIKVGQCVPFLERIVRVDWDDSDIVPNPEAFHEFMKNEIGPRMVPGKLKFSMTTEVVAYGVVVK